MDNKEVIRKQMRAFRSTLSEEKCIERSKIITSKFLDLPKVKQAKVFFVYVSKGREVHTHELIKDLLTQGKIVCVPYVTDEDVMIPVQIHSFDELKDMQHSYPVPRHATKFEGHIDVCVVPLLAISHNNERIGTGKGYYDKYLQKSQVGLTVGFAYSEQVLDILPQEDSDILLDTFVTDTHGKKEHI